MDVRIEVGTIHKMFTGQEYPTALPAVVAGGVVDTVTLPDELGGVEQAVVGTAVLATCPSCGNVEEKPALVLASGIRLSECLSCQQLLWYLPQQK